MVRHELALHMFMKTGAILAASFALAGCGEREEALPRYDYKNNDPAKFLLKLYAEGDVLACEGTSALKKNGNVRTEPDSLGSPQSTVVGEFSHPGSAEKVVKITDPHRINLDVVEDRASAWYVATHPDKHSALFVHTDAFKKDNFKCGGARPASPEQPPAPVQLVSLSDTSGDFIYPR